MGVPKNLHKRKSIQRTKTHGVLNVVSQEVVDIEAGSADLVEASMGTVPVVEVGPGLELIGSFC
jgi:hypothetical protein